MSFSVSATDPIYPANRLRLNCSAHSGSTFSIGTRTVQCAATNPASRHTSASFQMTVLSASQQTSALVQEINGYHLNTGLQAMFDNQLNLALTAINANKPKLARSYLSTFIAMVSAQHNYGISAGQSIHIVGDAQRIITVLGLLTSPRTRRMTVRTGEIVGFAGPRFLPLNRHPPCTCKNTIPAIYFLRQHRI